MKSLFGYKDNQEVYLYTIENDLIKVSVTNLGATLVSFIYKPLNRDIVLGFDNAETYLNQHGANMGATVGRCANRIGKGEFSLNGKTYHLTINNGPNTLHSGHNNLSNKIYDVIEKDNELIFKTVSEDGSDGFEGNLEVTITYALNGNNLEYLISGSSDTDTLFNITNHSYFNLEGVHSKSILNHRLMIPSQFVGLVDIDGLTGPNILEVSESGFDFRKETVIGDNLNVGHENISLVKGYDHNYLFEDKKDDLRAILKTDDISLKVSSDLPGMHLYSANYLDGEVKGKFDNYYVAKSGICFECQYYPNAINYTSFKKPIIKAGEIVNHYIKYSIFE